MKYGLTRETEIKNYLKEEFERFCEEVTKEVKITSDVKKSLLEQKIFTFLESNVGKGKPIPATRRETVYMIMKEILLDS